MNDERSATASRRPHAGLGFLKSIRATQHRAGANEEWRRWTSCRRARSSTDPLEDLLTLRFGARIDQPGSFERDFQTARSLDGKRSMPLSYRFYVADAVFVAAVEGEGPLIDSLVAALHAPVFPLYLGRRSCPPAGPVSIGVRDGSVEEALTVEPWHASVSVQRAGRGPTQRLELLTDGEASDSNATSHRDQPISYDPGRREYGWRSVKHSYVDVPNLHFRKSTEPATATHDPMLALGG